MIIRSLKLLSLFCTLSVIVLLVGALSGGAHASPTYLSQYNAAYGTAATCSLCHTTAPALNAKGKAFLNGGYNLASIAPSGNSTASGPATSTSPSAPSSPAQATNPANPKAPRNPRRTTSSNPNPSSGATNTDATGATSSGVAPTSAGAAQDNPTPRSDSENAPSPDRTEKDRAVSRVGRSNAEIPKREDADSRHNRELSQPSAHSPSSPRVEGNRVPRPNIQFRPVPRIRR